MVNGQAYDYDRQLADGIGPRLTGSDNYVHAVSWAQDQFRNLGLSNVHTESFNMAALWEPEVPATGHIIEPRNQTLHIYSARLEPLHPRRRRHRQSRLRPADSPHRKARRHEGKARRQHRPHRQRQLWRASRHRRSHQGPHRSRHRSPSGCSSHRHCQRHQNADSLAFGGSLSNFPVAQIGPEDELLIKRLLEKGPVTVQFSFKNRIRPATEVNNVIAEIPGRDLPKEIVIVGAHLDSWHPATGAQDNGTGVATVLEVARAIKSLNRPPRRTIRFILFGGEEQGLIGSTAYAKKHAADMAYIDAVLISDTGGQASKGWYLMGREDEKEALANIEPLLAGMGAGATSTDTEFLFETDHAGFDVQGVPTLVLWNGVDKYFKLHHQASDSFDSVVQADLNQGVAVTAATAYAIADSAQPFAPHLTAAEVQTMLKKANELDNYIALKSMDWVP